MLDKKEEKIINQIILYPNLKKVALAMLAGITVVWLVLEFIEENTFLATDSYQLGFYAYLAIMLFYIIIACFTYFKFKSFNENSIWLNLERRMTAVFTLKNDDEDGISLADIAKVKNKAKKASNSNDTLINKAFAALDLFELKAPNITLNSILLVLLPVFLLILVYTPRYIDLNNKKINSLTLTHEVLNRLNEAFIDDAYYVSYDNPLEIYYDYGYFFSAYLDYDMDSYISITVNNDAVIDYLSYNIQFLKYDSKEKSVEMIEEKLLEYYNLLTKANLSSENDKYFKEPILDDNFKEMFINNTENSEISIDNKNILINVFYSEDDFGRISYTIY